MMSTRTTIWLGGTALAAALALWHTGTTPVQAAGDAGFSAATTAAMSALGLGDDVEYIGSKKCKKCHLKEYKSWEDLKSMSTPLPPA